MVDWSASNAPGPRLGGRNGIWIATARDGAAPQVASHRTRHDAIRALTSALVGHVAAGRRTLVGFDFVFGYPAGTAASLGLNDDVPPWRAVWELLSERIVDGEDNRNNRFEIAAELNAAIGSPPGPFWGLAQQRPTAANLLPTRPSFPFRTSRGPLLEEWRSVESTQRAAGHRPKSAWQLYGAGSVGSQALVGVPGLASLRFHPGLADVSAVWPFETGFTSDPVEDRRPWIVYVEVYPSLLVPDPALHPVLDARQVLALVSTYRTMDESGAFAGAFGPADKPLHAMTTAVSEEGWVLGVTQTQGERGWWRTC